MEWPFIVKNPLKTEKKLEYFPMRAILYHGKI